jgi:hypothetical protein
MLNRSRCAGLRSRAWLCVSLIACSGRSGPQLGARDAATGDLRPDAGLRSAADASPATSGSGAAGRSDLSSAGHASSAAGSGGGAAGNAGRAALAGAGGDPAEDAGASDTCPGYALTVSEPVCNGPSDCAGGARCLLERPPTIGGVQPPDCRTHTCAAGTACVVKDFAIQCIAPCDATGAPGCAAGGVCAPGHRFADVLGCRPPDCSDLHSDCGPVSRCDPANASGRYDNGCVRLQCKTSADCSCGLCSSGQCYERPLHCFVQLFAP